MADGHPSAQDVISAPENLLEVAKSVGAELKKKLLEDSPRRKVHGFDIYGAQSYQDMVKRVLSHKVSGTTLAPGIARH
jgi:hypothetical protein